MLIAVCGDDAGDRARLAKSVRAILDARRLAAELREFAGGEALLAAMEQAQFSICFLDVFMAGISGVAAARRIRQSGAPTALVFTTSSPEYMADGFEVGAAHYLEKALRRGVGQTSVAAVAEKYGGGTEFVLEGHIYRASVLLNIPPGDGGGP